MEPFKRFRAASVLTLSFLGRVVFVGVLVFLHESALLSSPHSSSAFL